VNFSVQARQPGKQDTQPAGLDLLFAEELGEAPEPYERLLSDAMQGKARLFAREDSVEETWRIVQPLLETPGDPERYQPGTWGPARASKLVAGYPRWHGPWLPPRSPG
jgi:glucose-6-phosphate 1-dehydrogenase